MRIARAKEKRIKAIAAALGISDIVVVSTLVAQSAKAAMAVPGVPPVSRHKSRLRSLAESEGIDLDLLVNPDALEALSQEITVIR